MAKSTRRARAPVTVRSISNPRPGWSLEQAVDLLHQGYSPEQVERVTGYAARQVETVARISAGGAGSKRQPGHSAPRRRTPD